MALPRGPHARGATQPSAGQRSTCALRAPRIWLKGLGWARPKDLPWNHSTNVLASHQNDTHEVLSAMQSTHRRRPHARQVPHAWKSWGPFGALSSVIW